MKRILHLVFTYVLLLFLIVTFSGCSDSGNVSPGEYYALITKAKEFLNFSIYIINGDCKYWCQLFSRIYYSYLSLARIVFISKRGYDEEAKHTEIWKLNKKDVRHTYGKELKHIRTHFDYDFDSFNINVKGPEFKTYLKFILISQNAFKILIKDIREQIPKFYKHADDAEHWIKKCNDQLDRIVELQKELEENIQKKL